MFYPKRHAFATSSSKKYQHLLHTFPVVNLTVTSFRNQKTGNQRHGKMKVDVSTMLPRPAVMTIPKDLRVAHVQANKEAFFSGKGATFFSRMC